MPPFSPGCSTFWPTGERHSLPGATGDVEAGLGPATVQEQQHAVLSHYHYH